ncbi:hypothetical protein TWF281_003714 [Arthrobotrys megalospora]
MASKITEKMATIAISDSQSDKEPNQQTQTGTSSDSWDDATVVASPEPEEHSDGERPGSASPEHRTLATPSEPEFQPPAVLPGLASERPPPRDPREHRKRVQDPYPYTRLSPRQFAFMALSNRAWQPPVVYARATKPRKKYPASLCSDNLDDLMSPSRSPCSGSSAPSGYQTPTQAPPTPVLAPVEDPSNLSRSDSLSVLIVRAPTPNRVSREAWWNTVMGPSRRSSHTGSPNPGVPLPQTTSQPDFSPPLQLPSFPFFPTAAQASGPALGSGPPSNVQPSMVYSGPSHQASSSQATRRSSDFGMTQEQLDEKDRDLETYILDDFVLCFLLDESESDNGSQH